MSFRRGVILFCLNITIIVIACSILLPHGAWYVKAGESRISEEALLVVDDLHERGIINIAEPFEENRNEAYLRIRELGWKLSGHLLSVNPPLIICAIALLSIVITAWPRKQRLVQQSA